MILLTPLGRVLMNCSSWNTTGSNSIVTWIVSSHGTQELLFISLDIHSFRLADDCFSPNLLNIYIKH